jgi:HNH endonuclease
MLVPLSRGLVARIDAADARYAREKWSASKVGGRFYASRGGGRRRMRRQYLHRLVARARTGQCVDHINGDTLDNRRSNLRVCTRQQNLWNQRGKRDRIGRYKGTTPYRRRWVAQITVHRQRIYLGSFATDTAAALAYNRAARKHFGRFARLNAIAA